MKVAIAANCYCAVEAFATRKVRSGVLCKWASKPLLTILVVREAQNTPSTLDTSFPVEDIARRIRSKNNGVKVSESAFSPLEVRLPVTTVEDKETRAVSLRVLASFIYLPAG